VEGGFGQHLVEGLAAKDAQVTNRHQISDVRSRRMQRADHRNHLQRIGRCIGETVEIRQVLYDYFACTTVTTMSRYHRSAEDVPDGLHMPRWSWDGLVDGDATHKPPLARWSFLLQDGMRDARDSRHERTPSPTGRRSHRVAASAADVAARSTPNGLVVTADRELLACEKARVLGAYDVREDAHDRDDTNRHRYGAWPTHRLRARYHNEDDEGNHRWQPYERHHYADPEQDIVPKP
jgi:hypothetical protein